MRKQAFFYAGEGQQVGRGIPLPAAYSRAKAALSPAVA